MFIRDYLRRFFPLLMLAILSACTSLVAETTPTAKPAALTPFFTKTSSLTPIQVSEQPAMVISTPTPAPVIYSVKKDELGSAIALRFGITLQMLQSSNPEVDLNYLKEGQQLIIPPKQETPSPDMSSPTPAALIIKDVSCYPAADQAGWCIASILNNQQDGVMYITGEFILEGQQKTYQKPFTSLVDTLPSGKQIPVYALFEAPFPYPYQVNLLIHTALRQPPGQLSSNILGDPGSKGRNPPGWTFCKDRLAKSRWMIKKHLGYSDCRCLFRRKTGWYSKVGIESRRGIGNNLNFEIWVYSIGPMIDQVELFAELE